jgi:hypothetical protein
MGQETKATGNFKRKWEGDEDKVLLRSRLLDYFICLAASVSLLLFDVALRADSRVSGPLNVFLYRSRP